MALALSLFILLTSVTGVWTVKDVYVKEGEMMALRCNGHLMWSHDSSQRMALTDMSSAEARQMGLLLHDNSLVILRASKKHPGNYSCSLGNDWRLIVYTNLSKEDLEKTVFSLSCNLNEYCNIRCPDDDDALSNIPSITEGDITWYKDGDLLPNSDSFQNSLRLDSVKEKDRGRYTCTRSYMYEGQKYSKSYMSLLEVRPEADSHKLDVIKAPTNNEEVPVDFGMWKRIDCVAVVQSNYSRVVWLIDGNNFVGKNADVFDNYTREYNNKNKRTEARGSLTFKSVSAGDLSRRYTCKLQSLSQRASSVTVKLVLKARPSYHSLTASVGVMMVLLCVAVVVYVKFKIHIALVLRDTLGCHQRIPDGKTYDAFLMCYTSDKGAGLNAGDRRWLADVLEERFGYSLCLYDRDVPAGKAVAQAVLDCIEESRTVVLVPTALDPGLDSSLLSTIHAALVERQTRLVFIKPETSQAKLSESISEGLQLLSEVGLSITWRGSSSMSTSSSFWNELRYHLPPARARNKHETLDLESAALNNNRQLNDII